MQQGDTVTVTAYGLYPQPVQQGFFFSLAAWLSSILHPAQAPPPGQDGRRRRDLPLLQVGVAAGLTTLPQLSGGVPQGYLRVLVFNRDSALVGQQVQQLTQAALNSYQPLRLQVLVPQDGYVSAYMGNGSDVDVLFDDVQVEHRPGVQVQEVQYDPAGLELAGLAPASPGIKGLNNYRFNGKELQQDLGLSWNHQDWRFFDPQLLRWHAVDPELENGQESWTPYAFGYDNAVRYNDPNGRAPESGCPCGHSKTSIKPHNVTFRTASSIHVSHVKVNHDGYLQVKTSTLRGLEKNIRNVTNHSAEVLATSMRKAHLPAAQVNSTYRSPREDAAAMYTNASQPGGVEAGYRLYATAGDKVVDTFAKGRAAGLKILLPKAELLA